MGDVLDALIDAYGGAIEELTLAQLREVADACGLPSEGRKKDLSAQIEAHRTAEKAKERMREVMRGSLDDWKGENPVVGTIEWHLKKADKRIREAWEATVASVVRAWEKDHLGGGSKAELHELLRHIEGSLIPALVSASVADAPAKPTERPRREVTAEMVVRALRKNPDLLMDVRDRLNRLVSPPTYKMNWVKVRYRAWVEREIALDIPKDAPSGDYDVTLHADSYWKGGARFDVAFHAENGAAVRHPEAGGPPFPVNGVVWLDRGEGRKVIAKVTASETAMLKGVRLEATPRE
jgi:hypothetical protein